MKSLEDKTQVVITDTTLSNYTEASEDKKEKVDQTVSHAQAIIDKINGSNVSLDPSTTSTRTINSSIRKPRW